MTVTGIKAIIASIIAFVAMAIFVITVVNSTAYSPENEISLPTARIEYTIPTATPSGTGSPSVAAEYPLRLLIPSIKVDANIQRVGITKSGNMAPPSNFTDAGWYKLGTIPGQVGSAVIAGHVDNALSLPGVFSRLQDVRVGDSVYIDTEGGERLRFKVTDATVYNYKDVPTDMIFNQTGKARIRLITCGGTWVQSDKSYDERLVVTAELID